MIAVGKTAQKPTGGFPNNPETRERVEERLNHWRKLLLEHKAGLTNCLLSRREIDAALDHWLDEWIDQDDLRGRDPAIWDREWPASFISVRMSKEL